MQSIKTQNVAPYLRVEKTVKQEDKEPLKKRKKKTHQDFFSRCKRFVTNEKI